MASPFKAQLVAKLPMKNLDHVDVFITTLSHFKEMQIEVPTTRTYDIQGKLTTRQLRYRAHQIFELIDKHSEYVKKKIFTYWLEKLYSDRMIERILDVIGIVIPDELLPKTVKISRIAAKLMQSSLSRSRVCEEQRKVGVSFVVSVAKEAGLDNNVRGDAELLASATSCDWHFARDVLKAVKTGSEADLLKRNVKRDSIKATQWPHKIAEFVFRPENSRSVPGQDTVSVRYGVRRPKHILLKSRRDIAANFKTANPDCPFSVSVVMREFPQNAVTPTTRDLQRNTCPVHANARRLINCLHKNGVAKNISTSCRDIAAESMCKADHIDPKNPLTWEERCVFGECDKCPNVNIEIDSHKEAKMAKLSLWSYSKSQEKGKNVFGLFPQNKTISETASAFLEMLPKLRRHIYTAHHQWRAHANARDNLDINSIVTIEDYQQNLEVVYSEQPTSMAYSSNKLTVAVYPICVEFMDLNSSLKKGAIVFISSDKRHDFQQVAKFEKQMFQIVREKCPINNWLRFSDACASQFRSRKVNAKLLDAPVDFQLQHVSFDYFEAHEGKNISDSIGSIVKCAFQRSIAKSDQGITEVREIVDIIKKEVKNVTPKFEFLVVEEFPPFEREENILNYPLVGILNIHTLKLHPDGILAQTLSCLDCKAQSLCLKCSASDPTISVEDDDTPEEVPECIQDEDDDGPSDMSDASTSSDTDSYLEEESFKPGDVVWARHGRIWYPAKVLSPTEVPDHLKSSLLRHLTQNKVVVKWYGEDNYTTISVQHVNHLAENKLDVARAARSHSMQLLYQQALADVRVE